MINIVLGVFFSIIGYAYYRYGKKQENNVIRYSGIALMLYPYVVTDRVMILVVDIFLMALPKVLCILGR